MASAHLLTESGEIRGCSASPSSGSLCLHAEFVINPSLINSKLLLVPIRIQSDSIAFTHILIYYLSCMQWLPDVSRSYSKGRESECLRKACHHGSIPATGPLLHVKPPYLQSVSTLSHKVRKEWKTLVSIFESPCEFITLGVSLK